MATAQIMDRISDEFVMAMAASVFLLPWAIFAAVDA
jgi:hypothetical protein